MKKVISELIYTDTNQEKTLIYPSTKSEAVECSDGKLLEEYTEDRIKENIIWMDCGRFDDTIVNDYDLAGLLVSEIETMVVKEVEA